MHKLSLGLAIAAVTTLATMGPSWSNGRILGDWPTDWWVYGDAQNDPSCLRWNWQERSWYDLCWAARYPLLWRRARGPAVRAKD